MKPKGTWRSASMWSFMRILPSALYCKVPFGSRFRGRWYFLSPERASHYIKKATPEELEVINTHCDSLASELGYEVLFFQKKVK